MGHFKNMYLAYQAIARFFQCLQMAFSMHIPLFIVRVLMCYFSDAALRAYCNVCTVTGLAFIDLPYCDYFWHKP